MFRRIPNAFDATSLPGTVLFVRYRPAKDDCRFPPVDQRKSLAQKALRPSAFGIVDHRRRAIFLERRRKGLLRSHGNGRGRMVVRPNLAVRETQRGRIFDACSFLQKIMPLARAAEGLVRGRRHQRPPMSDGRRVHARRDQPPRCARCRPPRWPRLRRRFSRKARKSKVRG